MNTAQDFSPAEKLVHRTRRIMRRKHYSYQTEKRYVSWIRRFIHFTAIATRSIWVEPRLKRFSRI